MVILSKTFIYEMDDNNNLKMDHEDQKSLDNICNVCLDIMDKQYIITECNHLFCKVCITKWLKKEWKLHGKSTCPLCRHSLKELHFDFEEERFEKEKNLFYLSFLSWLVIGLISDNIDMVDLSLFF